MSAPGDVHLSAGSPAIGKGATLAGIPTNADGPCWTGAPDIGAY